MRHFLLLLLALPLAASTVRVYVVDSAGSDISVIDPSKNKAIGRIMVSDHPHGIAVSPQDSRLYASSETKSVLDVVDLQSGRVIRSVPLSRRPTSMALTPDGDRLYVCIGDESCVDILDTESLEGVNSVHVGRSPHNVYSTPEGLYMLVTSMGDRKITAVNIQTEKPEFEIPLGSAPRTLAMEAGPDGLIRRLFAQLSDLHGFAVVNYAARRVVGRTLLPDAPTGAEPLIPHTFSQGIGVAPDGKTLWVSSLIDNSVTVFSLPDLKRLTTIPVGHAPNWVTFAPDGKYCYVSDGGSDSVSVLDTRSYTESARIPVGRVPTQSIAVSLPNVPAM